MRQLCLFISICLLAMPCVYAQQHEQPKTEAQLVNRLLDCIRTKDTITYVNLFPEYDSVWKMATNPKSPDYANMSYLRQHPQVIQQFDPHYNKEIVKSFYTMYVQGKELHIHWGRATLVKYELEKMKLTKDLIGFDKIAPLRFKGYITIVDDASQKIFMFTASDMLNIKGKWYGGRFNYILQAHTKDEFLDKLNEMLQNKHRLNKDSSGGKTDVDSSEKQAEEKALVQKVILDRKYYTGKFDNEIPVKLYVRYLKSGGCEEDACAWEAIFKFGDEDYIKMKVSKNDKGVWIFTDERGNSGMELTLTTDTYTGSWANNDDQTGYDAKLTQKPASAQKTQTLDEIFENILNAPAVPTVDGVD